MKMKKIITILLVVAILAGFSVNAADRKLTLDRAIAINDTQIILEFSEPIAFNKYGSNNYPYIAVRYVNSGGGVYRIMDDKSPYYGTYLQWGGNVEYVDSKHDRVVFTVMSSVFGVDTLSGIFGYEGMLAEYDDCNIALVLEELPNDPAEHYGDNKICNITTRDGEVYLSPTRHVGYEACNLPIEVNYGYRVDLSATESTLEKAEPITWDFPLVTLSDGTEILEPEEPETPVTDVLKNDPLVIAAILGGSVLVSAVLIVLAIVVGKKRKAVS